MNRLWRNFLDTKRTHTHYCDDVRASLSFFAAENWWLVVLVSGVVSSVVVVVENFSLLFEEAFVQLFCSLLSVVCYRGLSRLHSFFHSFAAAAL
jgi:hypothetical protein